MIPNAVNTGYSQTGDGVRPGFTSQMERQLFAMLLSSYRQGFGMLEAGARTTFKQREYEWKMETKPGTEMTPYPAGSHFDDVTQVYDELFTLRNTIRRWKMGSQVADEAEILKQHFTEKQILGRFVRRNFEMIMRGYNLAILTSELVDASQGSPPEQFAGFGLNETGDALRPRASAKWDTDIAEANSRMTYTDLSGNPWSFDLMLQGMQDRWEKSGLKDIDWHIDIVTGKIVSGWQTDHEMINYKPKEHSSERLLRRITTVIGDATFHIEGENFPNQAICGITHGGQYWKYGPLTQQGLQTEKMARNGDITAVLTKYTGGLMVCIPNSHVIFYDRGAAA